MTAQGFGLSRSIADNASPDHLDEDLVREFIRWLGAFPVGTLVELHTGEVAVVVEKHRQYQLRPRVVVLRDAAKQRCTPRYLDLAQITVDEEGAPYRISVGLPDGSGMELLSDNMTPGKPTPIVVSYTADEPSRALRAHVDAALVKSRHSVTQLLVTVLSQLEERANEQDAERRLG